jgi:hypothetical protein
VNATQSAPLLDAVLERGNRLQDKPFHVPGHKVTFLTFEYLFVKILQCDWMCVSLLACHAAAADAAAAAATAAAAIAAI